MSTDEFVGERESIGDILGKCLRNRSFVVGGIITVVLVLMAAISLFWTPYPITELEIARKLKAPSGGHWFGTDHFGRDVFSMIMVGARNSIAVAFVAVGIGIGIGVPLGTLAAARGGLVDEALMRFNDFVFAFPALLSAVMITAIFGPGAINAHCRHRHLQHPGLCAYCSRRRAEPLAARIHSRRPGFRQEPGKDHHRTHHSEHPEHPDRSRHHPILARHPGRGRSELCGAWHPAADGQLGEDAQ